MAELTGRQLIAFSQSHKDSSDSALDVLSCLEDMIEGGAELYLTLDPKSRKVMGYAIVYPRSTCSYLAEFFVYPAYRKSKIGSRMVNRVCEDHPRLCLSVKAQNKPARKLYQKTGFVDVSPLIPNFYSAAEYDNAHDNVTNHIGCDGYLMANFTDDNFGKPKAVRLKTKSDWRFP